MNTSTFDSIAHYIAMAQAVARMTFAQVYLWDNVNRKFLYFASNKTLLGGRSAQYIMSAGMDELVEMIPPEDLEHLRNVAASFEANYHRIPQEWRSEVVVYLNFYIGRGKDAVLVSHKISWLEIDENGRPGIIFGIATPSVHRKERHVFVKIEGPDIWRYFNPETKQWEDTHRIRVTGEERQMLRLSQSGHSSTDIARLMHKSTHTINFYRKSMFEKLGVTNISEAIAHAAHYGLL